MKTTLGMFMAFTGLLLPVLAEGETAKPGMDENLSYEPIQIVRTVELVFPERLIRESIDRGEANVMVMINNEGQLLDWLVIGYSHPLFVTEVLDVIQKWKFIPAHIQGKAVTTRVELKFFFKDSSIVRILPIDTGLIARMKRHEIEAGYWSFICRQEELDGPLDAKVEISPMPPDQLGATASEGKVIVDYLIDPEGKVRMPLIISADDEAFANSVLMAINECRYVVPRREGVPVITRARKQFIFSPVST